MDLGVCEGFVSKNRRLQSHVFDFLVFENDLKFEVLN